MESDMLTTANGLEFSYRAHGRGPTLVLLHAFPLNKRMWLPQVDALSDACQVVTIDLRGFGSSQYTDDDFTLADMAEDVHALLHKLGYGHVVLGGLSMGGYIAQAYMRRYPQHVRGLVLANTRSGADTPEARAKREAMVAEVQARGVRGVAKSFPAGAVSPRTAERRPELLQQLEVWIAETPAPAIIGAQRAMAGRPDNTPHLGEIGVPTLVIAGEDDTVTPLAEAEAMQRAIPGAELAVMPEAGHLSNMEAPEAFNAAVRTFMRRFVS